MRSFWISSRNMGSNSTRVRYSEISFVRSRTRNLYSGVIPPINRWAIFGRPLCGLRLRALSLAPPPMGDKKFFSCFALSADGTCALPAGVKNGLRCAVPAKGRSLCFAPLSQWERRASNISAAVL